jgi:hypothetical protein
MRADGVFEPVVAPEVLAAGREGRHTKAISGKFDTTNHLKSNLALTKKIRDSRGSRREAAS